MALFSCCLVQGENPAEIHAGMRALGTTPAAAICMWTGDPVQLQGASNAHGLLLMTACTYHGTVLLQSSSDLLRTLQYQSAMAMHQFSYETNWGAQFTSAEHLPAVLKAYT